MHCITTFLEDIDHEMPSYCHMSTNREAYKVDGTRGIKVYCGEQELKSVDYYDDHPEKGFIYLEFSDLIAQDNQIKVKLEKIQESDLPKELNKEIRKQYYRVIHQELVQKIKDSVYLRNLIMPNHVKNIPDTFTEIGKYVVVIAPIEEGKKADVARCIDRWKQSILNSIPKDMHQGILILPLDIYINS
ncbi:hypothetical protein [Acinetobacter haemolyticus]|uniref:hypothetical protein n=1 Tax=Acinetobacter haemolyticus TaxID=29430 RepID=UPI003F57FE3C